MQDDSVFDNTSQDNAVSYELYANADASGDKLRDLKLECMAVVLPYLTHYIWQQDSFALQTSTVSESPWSKRAAQRQQKCDQSLPAHLWGVTRFGDNIEDEWFIVWLLTQITLKFTSISARIWDNDGDFLLIEAAYSLPRWLKPETSSNRIWLQAGCLHVIPLPSKHHPTLPASPTASQALQIISSDSITTKASSGMQEAIKGRIKGYPNKAVAEMHRARCTIPLTVAHILQQKPQLVSPAVQTFHYRDMQDMKAAAKLAVFPPQDVVTTIVTFNRALYAQLAQQQFEPPRSYPLPPPTNPAFKAADLGMKLTCGFEMVMAKGSSGSASAASTGTTSQDRQLSAAALKDNTRWAAYQASLAKNGYFKGNIPGSVQYKALLAEAAQSFMHTQGQQQSVGPNQSPAETIAAILEQPIQPENFQDGLEDDDSWMTGGAADLEAELAKRQKELEGNVAKHAKRTAQGLAEPEAAAEFDPSEMVSKMKAFVNQVSGHEGAEVPQNVDPDVSFDNPAFWRELKAALGVAADKHGVDLGLQSDSASSSEDFSDDDLDALDDDDDSQDSSAAAGSDYAHENGIPLQFSQAMASSSQLRHTMQPNGATADEKQPCHASRSVPHDEHSDDASEVLTATDSDDDDTRFMDAYNEALADELSGSRVGSILDPDIADKGKGVEQPKASGGVNNHMKPVDLDTNLVRNLLQSYTAQQGLAGPAGNLAGLLGLTLPDNAEAE